MFMIRHRIRALNFDMQPEVMAFAGPCSFRKKEGRATLIYILSYISYYIKDNVAD